MSLFHTRQDKALPLLIGGSRKAFEEIYHTYAVLLINFARKSIANKEDCEEIVQEVFESLWAKRATLQHLTSMRAYLFKMVRYKIVDYIRHSAVKKKYEAHYLLFARVDNSGYAKGDLSEIHAFIDHCVRALPDRCQTAFRLRFDENLSYKDTATLALMQGSASSYIKNSVGDPDADPGFQLKLLPADYYTLSDDSKIVIEKGQHSGTVTVIPDSAAFLSDPATLMATYVLPLRLIGTDAAGDSILSTKDFAVIGLKYENMLFGNYWHGGVTVEKDPAGNVVNTTTYYTTIPSAEAQVWRLKTVEPFALTIDGVSDISSSNVPEMKITLNGGDIQVSAMPGATFNVEPNGTSVFNQSKLLQDRRLFLNYKYVNGSGNTCYATDTLTFRNRIRDGINEWQDENPSHYD